MRQPDTSIFGLWNGGRYLHYGVKLEEDAFVKMIRQAYDAGLRTFMTSDVYGNGEADEMLRKGLSGIPREDYAIVSLIGHDFYVGERAGAKGFPRFTDPALREKDAYEDYLKMALEKSLERCGTDYFDVLMLHNPDRTGYTSDVVWKTFQQFKEEKTIGAVGVAPGPANGFSLDLIRLYERFAGMIDWSMIILSPMEPWPGAMSLGAAEKAGVKVMTRVVDFGGVFFDDVKPNHVFGERDHRAFRPGGWVEEGNEKLEKMRPIAEKYGISMFELSASWNLAQPSVKAVVPTIIQEKEGRPILKKIQELAKLQTVSLTKEEQETLAKIGNNKGCMDLRGANPQYQGDPIADRWQIDLELERLAQQWGIDPVEELRYIHA